MIEVRIGGRVEVLECVGDEIWASDSMVQLAHIVVRRTGGLYSADVGNGVASCRDTPQDAVSAAERDAQSQPRKHK
jgi:hypothetical protein